MKKWLFATLFILVFSTAFSQQKVTGTILDETINKGIPGVNVTVKGSGESATTDIDGNFTIITAAISGQITFSYVGFLNKTVDFKAASGQTINLGTIILVSDENQLSEIVVRGGVADIAKDRKTPVAASTIKAAEIREKLGSQEFPEILKNTPSVYVTKSGGGFGDSRINIRGFDQKNIAVMINGVPVNDMENSAVYWSNWAGLSDVTSAMQVQRGLGSSKLAITSVGGTINILTKSSDMKQGGSFSTSVGNDKYLKSQGSYSTGLLENGLSASVLLSSTIGDGYVDGTKFEAQNYFIAFGYKPNDKHDFQVTFTGAPQWHHQRSTGITIDNYKKFSGDQDPNIRYNSDWGTLNGSEFNMKRNFYHKPVASVNWDWTINDKTKISTILYGSWGRGGGSTGAGGIRGNNYLNTAFRKADGTIDFDRIYAYNSGQTVTINGTQVRRIPTGNTGQFQNTASTGATTDTNNGISRISSFNSHDWYGGIINFNRKLSQKLTLDFGIDARTYKGIHYQNLNNLLGADVFVDKTDLNNPNRVLTETYYVSPSLNPFSSASVNEKIGYDYDGKVSWYGAFNQLEYSTDKLNAFVQGAFSQQGFKKTDRFNYPATIANPEVPGSTITNPDYALRDTDYENILGGNVKGGVNYNFNESHNVFANAGYYSKQPFFNAVYPNNRSKLNGNLVNEQIVGVEAGYGFRSAFINANVNVYNTEWKDRYQRANDNDPLNPGGYFDYSGISEVHSGVELELNSRITQRLRATAMFSYGNWEYKGNSVSNRYDAQNNTIDGEAKTLYLDKVKVGDAAQITASLGASYEIFTGFILDANYNFNDKLYARISPDRFIEENNKGSLELPSYGLADAGISFRLPLGRTNSMNFRLNVNNVFNEIYIAESSTNIFASDNVNATDPSQGTYASNNRLYNGVATANQVFFGFGRTWNFTLRYDF